MKLEFTWNSILKANACSEGKDQFLADFKDFDPISKPDKPINLLSLLEINGAEDTLWALRANIQDDKTVAIEIANRAATRAKKYANNTDAASAAAAYAARAADAAYAARAADAAVAVAAAVADAAAYAARAAYTARTAADAAYATYTTHTTEREKQKQDLIKLLQE